MSKPTAGDGLQSFRLLSAGSGLAPTLARTEMSLSDILREYVKRQRANAGFFHWHDRSADGKSLVECDVVNTLFDTMRAQGLVAPLFARASADEWPDCEAHHAALGHLAVEVTELVDAESLRPGGSPKPWSGEQIFAALERSIASKDSKAFHGGKYSACWLVLHTDEMYLSPSVVSKSLEGKALCVAHGNIDAAYLLFSPVHDGYQFLSLPISPPQIPANAR